MSAGLAFTAESAAFARALRAVRNVIESRATIPILANVLIEVGDDVRLRTTNLDQSASLSFACAVERPGGITVDGTRLSDIVGALDGGSQCRVEWEPGKQLTVAAGRARFRLATIPPTDFPPLKALLDPATLTIDRRALAGLLATARPTVCTEETRYYLCGALAHVVDGKLRLVSTDGSRMTQLSYGAPRIDGAWRDVIVPTKTIDLIRTACAEGEGDISVAVDDALVDVDFGHLRLTSKLIDATYPDYQRAIPAAVAGTATVNRDALLAAVKRVLIARPDGSRGLKFEITRDTIMLEGSALQGDGREDVPCEFDGADFVSGINGVFLRDLLNALDTDTIDIGVNGPRDPMLFTTKTRPDDRFVVMPMYH